MSRPITTHPFPQPLHLPLRNQVTNLFLPISGYFDQKIDEITCACLVITLKGLNSLCNTIVMTISNPMRSVIDCLESVSDPAVAYFSFETDDTGEYGAIRANKEGLRRYALELLKKSVEMEEKRDGQVLCFQPYEWLVSDAGYDLIRCVKPEYASRTEILASNASRMSVMPGGATNSKQQGCFTAVLAIAASCLCTAALLIRLFS